METHLKESQFAFDKATHTYTVDGKKMTGITTIIGVLAKPALIGWAAKMATEYILANAKKCDPIEGSDEEVYWVTRKTIDEAKSAHTKKKEAAGEHGTDTHELVELYVNECIKQHIIFFDYPEDHPIYQFAKWAYENVDHFLFSERQMFNKELFIAGTADFGAVMKDGKKLIGDFKTSSGVYGIDYFLQCAGYKILAESEGDEPYDGCVIVRLGKDNSFDVHYRYDNQTDKDAFLACLTLYRAQATFTKPTK